jgi:hypothetical protein
MGFSIFAAAALVEEVSDFDAFVVLFEDFEVIFAFVAGLVATFVRELDLALALETVAFGAFFSLGVATFFAGADFLAVLVLADFFAGAFLAAGATFLVVGATFLVSGAFLLVAFS